jgi:transposase
LPKVFAESKGGHNVTSFKRLEQGRFHFPPAAPAGAVELTAAQFHMILDGIDLSRLRRFKRYQGPVPA